MSEHAESMKCPEASIKEDQQDLEETMANGVVKDMVKEDFREETKMGMVKP